MLTAKATDDEGATATSTAVSITVKVPLFPPVITKQPASQTVAVGSDVLFTVEATGTGPLKYQWYFNGAPIPGATGPSLNLTGVPLESAGTYSVVVSNVAGSTPSLPAILTVNQFWPFAAEDWIRSSPAIGADGTIYFGSADNKVYALDKNGAKKWEFLTGWVVEASPLIGPDGTIYFRSYDDSFYALNPDGSKLWDFQAGSSIYSSPAVAADGTVYFESYDSRLYALDTDGTMRWSFATGDGILSSPAIGTNGVIYVGSRDVKFYALNTNGTMRWSFARGGEVNSSPSIGNDGTIYFGSYDHRIYALNPDGSKRWSFATGDAVFASPAIGADGTIYCGSSDGKLYALNPDGSEKWELAVGAGSESSVAIGNDGTIYFGSYDNHLYAATGTTLLGDTPWPMFRRNVRHTGALPKGVSPQFTGVKSSAVAMEEFAPPAVGDQVIEEWMGSPRMLDRGQVELTILGQAGRNYRIEISSDLVNGSALSSGVLTDRVIQLIDFPPSDTKFRFHRLVRAVFTPCLRPSSRTETAEQWLSEMSPVVTQLLEEIRMRAVQQVQAEEDPEIVIKLSCNRPGITSIARSLITLLDYSS